MLLANGKVSSDQKVRAKLNTIVKMSKMRPKVRMTLAVVGLMRSSTLLKKVAKTGMNWKKKLAKRILIIDIMAE